MITVPPILTPMHDSEVRLSGPVHEELVRKIAQNLNFLGNLIPIGTIVFVEINKIGVTAPDESIWQLCDGSEITNASSPLRTVGLIQRFTPNLLGKHSRCSGDDSTNPTGGSYSYNFGHNHTGLTDINQPAPANAFEEDGPRRVGNTHVHGVSMDLTSLTFDFPKAVKYVPYMKIT